MYHAWTRVSFPVQGSRDVSEWLDAKLLNNHPSHSQETSLFPPGSQGATYAIVLRHDYEYTRFYSSMLVAIVRTSRGSRARASVHVQHNVPRLNEGLWEREDGRRIL